MPNWRWKDAIASKVSGHYRVVLDLRKLLFFPVGVDEFMAESVARIEPGDDGLGLHRAAVRERERSVV
jgi:hypothetical protein